jgi:hypothetical protein
LFILAFCSRTIKERKGQSNREGEVQSLEKLKPFHIVFHDVVILLWYKFQQGNAQLLMVSLFWTLFICCLFASLLYYMMSIVSVPAKFILCLDYFKEENQL